MKSVLKYVVIGLAVSMLAAGCAKPPAEEKAAAQAAIDAAVAEGANVYGKDELRSLNDMMTQANDEEKLQEGKLFKKFDKEKEILDKVLADAEALKAAIPARKEQAKNDAMAALEAAKAAVAEASNLLKKAPRGKGTKADIEAMNMDLKGIEESLPGVQQMIAAEDFYGAADKAKALSQRAAGISEQVKMAMEKVKGKK